MSDHPTTDLWDTPAPSPQATTNLFAEDSENRFDRVDGAKSRAMDRLSPKESLGNSFTDMGDGWLESNSNKIWNDMSDVGIQSLRDNVMSMALTTDEQGRNFNPDGTEYTGAVRRLYSGGTKEAGSEAFKLGVARGDKASSAARYDPLQGGYVPGANGIDTENFESDILLPYGAATMFEAVSHGRKSAIDGRVIQDLYNNPNAKALLGGGASEYYKSREALFGAEVDVDKKLGSELFKEYMAKLPVAKSTFKTGSQFLLNDVSHVDTDSEGFKATSQSIKDFMAGRDTSVLEDLSNGAGRLGNTVSGFAASFVNELLVKPLDAVGDLTGAFDLDTDGDTIKAVEEAFGYDSTPVQETMEKITGYWDIAASDDATTAQKVRAVGNGVLEALITPEMLGTSLGMLLSWMTPGAVLKGVGVGSKFANTAKGINASVAAGQITAKAGRVAKAKAAMSVDGVKAAVTAQSGYITSSLGNVNKQFEDFTANNNGVELEGQEKAEWFAGRFAVQIINQNIDKIVDFNVMKSPGILKALVPAVKAMSEKEFVKVVKLMGKGVAATTAAAGAEAVQEYIQTTMELFNSRYGSEQFSDLDTFAKFLQDSDNIREAGAAAIAGAGGSMQFEAAGVVSSGLGENVSKGITALSNMKKVTETSPETVSEETAEKFTPKVSEEEVSEEVVAQRSTEAAAKAQSIIKAYASIAEDDELEALMSAEDESGVLTPKFKAKLKEIVDDPFMAIVDIEEAEATLDSSDPSLKVLRVTKREIFSNIMDAEDGPELGSGYTPEDIIEDFYQTVEVKDGKLITTKEEDIRLVRYAKANGIPKLRFNSIRDSAMSGKDAATVQEEALGTGERSASSYRRELKRLVATPNVDKKLVAQVIGKIDFFLHSQETRSKAYNGVLEAVKVEVAKYNKLPEGDILRRSKHKAITKLGNNIPGYKGTFVNVTKNSETGQLSINENSIALGKSIEDTIDYLQRTKVQSAEKVKSIGVGSVSDQVDETSTSQADTELPSDESVPETSTGASADENTSAEAAKGIKVETNLESNAALSSAFTAGNSLPELFSVLKNTVSEDGVSRKIIDMVSVVVGNDTKIRAKTSSDPAATSDTAAAHFDPNTNEIIVYSDSGDLSTEVLLHESLHAASSSVIRSFLSLGSFVGSYSKLPDTPSARGFQQLNELLKSLKKHPDSKKFTKPLANVGELVSYGLTNIEFSTWLDGISMDSLGAGGTFSDLQADIISPLTVFKDGIIKLLGFGKVAPKERTALYEVMTSTDALLSSEDVSNPETKTASADGVLSDWNKAAEQAKNGSVDLDQWLEEHVPNPKGVMQSALENSSGAGKARTYVYAKEGERDFQPPVKSLSGIPEGAMYQVLDLDPASYVTVGTTTPLNTLVAEELRAGDVRYTEFNSLVEGSVALLEKAIRAPSLTYSGGDSILDLSDSPAASLLFDKDLKINENIAVALRIGLNNYIRNSGYLLGKGSKNKQDIAELLGKDASQVTKEMVEMMANRGMLYKTVSDSVGKDVVSMLGLRRNTQSDSDSQAFAALVADLGQTALIMGVAEGNLKIDGTLSASLFASTVLGETAEAMGEGNNAKVIFIEAVDGKEDVFGEIASSSKNIEDLIPGINSARRPPSLVPLTSKEKKASLGKIRNEALGIKVATASAEALEELIDTEWTADLSAMRSMLEDEELIKTRLGFIEIDKDNPAYAKLSFEKKQIQPAINRRLDSSFEEMRIITGEHEEDGVSLWFDYFFSKNGRFFIDSNTIQPQTEKHLHRFTTQPKSHTFSYTKKGDVFTIGDVDVTDKVHYALAQGFGAATDKKDTAKNAAFSQEIIKTLDTAEKIKQARQYFLEGRGTKQPKQAALTLEAYNALDIDLEHLGHALQAFQFLTDSVNSNSFSSSITAEFDAVTSGFGLKNLQIPILDAGEDWRRKVGIIYGDDKILNRAGIVSTDGQGDADMEQGLGAVSMNDVLDTGGLKDSYQTLAAQIEELDFDQMFTGLGEYDKLTDNKYNRKLWVALSSVLPKLNADGSVSSKLRSLFKYPFMTFNYAASIKNIRNNLLVGDMMDGLIESMAKVDLTKTEGISDADAGIINLMTAFVGSKGSAKALQDSIRGEAIHKVKSFDGSQTTMEKEFSMMINASYGSQVEDALMNEFGPFVTAQENINHAFKAMFEIFAVEFDEKLLAARANGAVTVAEERKIYESLKDKWPAIKGPLSRMEDSATVGGIGVYATETSSPWGVHSRRKAVRAKLSDEMQDEIGQNDIRVSPMLKKLAAAVSAGSVIPIHYIDGAVMAKTVSGAKKRGVDGITTIHDAIMPPMLGKDGIDGWGIAQQEYNKETLVVNAEYSFIHEINSQLQKVAGEAFKSKNSQYASKSVVVDHELTLSLVDYIKMVSSVFGDFAVEVNDARTALYKSFDEKGVQIMHMAGTENGVYSGKPGDIKFTPVEEVVVPTYTKPTVDKVKMAELAKISRKLACKN